MSPPLSTSSTVQPRSHRFSFRVCKSVAGCHRVVLTAGRAPELSADLMEKFRQFSLETGVLAENIVFLPKNGSYEVLGEFTCNQK